ncbi:ROK family protein [Peptococcaceae bacterium]|nr:ROK family protein [Peptococcaceae bacterium]
MFKRECIVGIDIGGTKILTVVAGMHCNVLAKVESLTNAFEGYERVIDRIVSSIYTALERAGIDVKEVCAAAACVPGPELDVKKGVVYFAGNLNWKNVDLKEILERKLKVPVFIENDANSAALGECLFGAGQGTSDMVYVTVSTGIGCGIIINKKIYHGASDSAGEIGHMVVLPGGPACSCGNRGCLEALASGTAIARDAKELAKKGCADAVLKAAGGEIEKINALAVAKAAKAGDGTAKEIFYRAGRMLGLGLANLVNLINPSLIVLGGGVMKSKELMWEPMEKEFYARAIKRAGQNVEIVSAELGSMSGIMGALAIARSYIE